LDVRKPKLVIHFLPVCRFFFLKNSNEEMGIGDTVIAPDKGVEKPDEHVFSHTFFEAFIRRQSSVK
jgi:hypothetical protein